MINTTLALVLTTIMIAAPIESLAENPVEADYVLCGATLYDGTDSPGELADVAILKDRIVAVGSFEAVKTAQVLDVRGLIVAPGFIDLHNHSDKTILVPKTRANVNYLMQGVTTIVTGNCGSGKVDVGDYFKQIDKQGAGTNVIHLVPQGAVRKRVMGSSSRKPTDTEQKKMEQLVEQAMRDGAWGMSSGLVYVPGSFASTDDLVGLAKVVQKHGGIYASHIRNEGPQLAESIEEAIEIGQRANTPVLISHLKAAGRRNWGSASVALDLIRKARAKGQAVFADQYPYDASSTSLAAMMVPPLYRSHNDINVLLDDADEGPKLRDAIKERLSGRDGAEHVFIANYQKKRNWQGKSLAAIAKQENESPLDIIVEILRSGGARAISQNIDENEVRRIMVNDFVLTSSDGRAQNITEETVPHPRNYGAFSRKIGRYAIAQKVVPLPHAIRSATGLPADLLKLRKRGYLKKGYVADLVVFDPNTYRDTATFDNPHQYATGVKYLFVGGTPVIKEGKYSGKLNGRTLRRQDHMKNMKSKSQ